MDRFPESSQETDTTLILILQIKETEMEIH